MITSHASAEDLVRGLSLLQKATLVSGASFWRTAAIEEADVEGAVLSDGPHGVRYQGADHDHLGLGGSEPATAFPTASATGSSWNPQLLERMGRALGDEARALGVDVLLGPGVNIKRSPLCGRNFEYFSEDPFLSGALGTAWVEGVQSRGVGASVKHFAANNQETDRMRVSAEVDERSLREIYLPAFERIVREARPATVMASYNRINGTFASENSWLLSELLRGDWDFDGYVVSDWGAVRNPAAALAAGLDLEMPGTGGSARAIVEAVESGDLREGTLDRAVVRILTVHERLRAAREEAASVDHDAHHELARQLAVESSVLLKNSGQLLPLDPDTGGAIAVIGEFARSPRYQGAGSSHIVPTRLDDALTAIRRATSRSVMFAPGYALADDDAHDPEALIGEAEVHAARADVVVLFLGLPARDESEGFDRTTLALPARQLELLGRVAAVNPRVVVVLNNGGVVDLRDVVDAAETVLEMWLPGQAGGSAAAELLFGFAEPSGRLAETIPLALADTPAFVNWPGSEGEVHYGERIYVGYRWYDKVSRDVAFPFGHGLGYTSFAYADLEVRVPDSRAAGATVEVTVKNTGSRAGSEVVQVYVGDPEATLDRPLRELKGFAKVRLEPGEEARVSIALDERAFAFWSAEGWVVEPGAFDIEVGASSRDIRAARRIRLDVPARKRELTADSTVAEWFADPVGKPIVARALSVMGDKDATSGGLGAADAMTMVASLPLVSLFAFGVSEPESVVQSLLEQVRAAPTDAPEEETA